MTRGKSAASASAFTLVEIIIVLGLLAVFALIAGLLFRASLRTWATAGQAIEVAQRFDLMMSRLRADVWQAERIDADGATATVRLAGGGAVVWAAQPDGTVTRDEQPAAGNESAPPPQRRRWERVGQDVRFEAEGPTLRVSVAAGGGERDEATLVSQLLLAGRFEP